eukprot:TRINITY_DN65070_c0_g1_i1.p1 TRINITY_DN65070_c0_g1~~TRINITY_DN65070_c0_g1_i1.p1  ORF type:complete len:737 (+),score=184.98 TRINITY_DN65070_c0_g1_i1:92-2212(+)
MALSASTHEFPYLLTYGAHEFLSGSLVLPLGISVAQALSAILNKHHLDIASANDGAGSCLGEMYSAMVTNQLSIRISCHGPDQWRDLSAPLTLADTLAPLPEWGRPALRFHLDVDQLQGSDYRKRLQRFYAHYDPTKLVAVDGMLQDARGFEEHLIAALVRRYGPEPGESVDIRFRDRLLAFYHHYRKDKVSEVDEILMEYRGAEEQLFAALVAKYGPEPIIMGSDLGTEDSYTFVSDGADAEPENANRIAVPLMPFSEPLPESELPPDDASFTVDVNFWDNFVNQVPDEAQAVLGIDCNQELLRQHLRSYPLQFPHLITVCCPFHEQTFRADDTFWNYVCTRSHMTRDQLADAAAAGGKHILRCVSSRDPGQVCVLTRREWHGVVTDWESAHGLVRKVKVDSVALENGVAAQYTTLPPMNKKAIAQPTCTQASQTVATAETQTAPAPPTPPPTPPPVERVERGTDAPRRIADRVPRPVVPSSRHPSQLLSLPQRALAPGGEPPPPHGDPGELEPCLLEALRAVRGTAAPQLAERPCPAAAPAAASSESTTPPAPPVNNAAAPPPTAGLPTPLHPDAYSEAAALLLESSSRSSTTTPPEARAERRWLQGPHPSFSGPSPSPRKVPAAPRGRQSAAAALSAARLRAEALRLHHVQSLRRSCGGGSDGPRAPLPAHYADPGFVEASAALWAEHLQRRQGAAPSQGRRL